MEAAIINRGRGPEIAGTRITVYTIIDYLNMGWHHTLIAATLRISSAQVLAAEKYIEDHKEEVTAAYQRILERSANARNPPEVEAKLVQSRAKLQAALKEIQDRKARETNGHAGNPGGQ